ncbi:MAG: HAD-IA family hydrolase [Clostridia bacterium]|nr:HAD-IA family hydrolase [Clostridia bacterium]
MGYKFDTVIFDLDGTLLDTLDDLADAVNAALTAQGYPARTREEVCAFVGNGVGRLMERAVPGGRDDPRYDACMEEFVAHYRAHCQDKTVPYPGIVDLLTRLKAGGVRTAVVSNKFDLAVKALCAHYFDGLIGAAIGETASVRRKPAPDTVLEALRQLRSDPAHAVYVGDSDVDVLTARNAGLPCISVTWGFRDAAFLRESGAAVLVSDADALYQLLTK